jgi:predicted transcriptional regulator
MHRRMKTENTPRVTVELPPALFDDLRRLAAQEDRSIASAVRRAIQREVARHESEAA